jgi:cytochrome P450
MRRLRERIRVALIPVRMRGTRRIIRCDRLWRLARRFRPVLSLAPRQVFVTRHDDVLDVLRRDRDFGVPYLPNLIGLRAPFLLGFPDGDDYARQRDVLAGALRDPRLPSVEQLSVEEAQRVLAAANGGIDVVAELTDQVLLSSVGLHLGLGRGTPGQLAQSRAIFQEIFINGLRDPAVIARAEAAGAALRAHIAEVAADRRAAMARGAAGDVDVLHLLLLAEEEGHLSMDELINSLLGIFVGWATPVSRSMGFGIDALLRDAERVRVGREAARAGGPAAVREVMREALRFQPSAPALDRICTRETRIAGRRIRRGTQVVALVNSAMMDDARVSAPRSFTPGRGPEANLHFGSDLHRCIGEHIAMTQIGAIASVLLAHADLRRAGRLELEGPFPSRLPVAFGRA